MMLEDSDSPLSCVPGVPLVAFDGDQARASVLNYNLPASTAFTVRNFIPVDFPSGWYRAPGQKLSDYDLTRKLAGMRNYRGETPDAADDSAAAILRGLQAGLRRRSLQEVREENGDSYAAFDVLGSILTDLAVEYPALAVLAARDLKADAMAFDEIAAGLAPRNDVRMLSGSMSFGQSTKSIMEKFAVLTGIQFNPHQLLANISAGKTPVLMRNLFGQGVITYVDGVTRPRARLFVIEEYEIASFLGDYGAGRTLKTFSLLPGEKTTITIKSWRTSESELRRGENVLDSFSEDSSQQFESMAEDELRHTAEYADDTKTGWSNKDTTASSSGGNVSAGLKIGIGPVGFNVGGSYSGSSSSTGEAMQSGSTSVVRKNTADALSKAMDRHVSQSSSARKFEVNTETSQSNKTTAGSEESVVREISNINHSRVLNFVFRQLSQEFLTITYLKDVSLGATYGKPGDAREAKLNEIDAFLAEYLKPQYVAEARRAILRQLTNVYDHEGSRHSFIEKVDEEYRDIEAGPNAPAETISYFRKDSRLTQSWRGKDVPGIILNVASRILVTDALVVEALLGQGEALDCYNMRLQDAAARKANVANRMAEAAVDIVSEGGDPAARADAFAKVNYPPVAPEADDA